MIRLRFLLALQLNLATTLAGAGQDRRQATDQRQPGGLQFLPPIPVRQLYPPRRIRRPGH